MFKTPDPPGINRTLIDSLIVALSVKDLLKLYKELSLTEKVSVFASSASHAVLSVIDKDSDNGILAL